jgi:hypothetical protein
MFVRWHHYQRQDGSVYWNAALITVARINGQPRHKHLTSLAGIAEADAKANAEACREFWRKALAKLKAQKLSKVNMQKAMAALAIRVPRPDAAQLKEWRLRELGRDLQDAERHVSRIKREMKGLRVGRV